jgi:hypothetical protein
MHGNAHRKTTIWLGSDDGDEDGFSGYGFDVGSEDNTISVTAQLEDDRGEELEIFICRDLFPRIRAVMDRIDKRFEKKDRKQQ